MYTMGDNSVFKRASEARREADIASWQERLEVAKSSVIIDGLGTFNPDKYFEYIEKEGIIEEKDIDIIKNDDGTYDVTTKPGYIFQVELMPNKGNPTDAEITYLGQSGKILPIIKQIEVSATPTSIAGKSTVVRLGNGTVTYYYKLALEADSEYKEITNVNSETGATQSTGITEGEKYIIKVVVKNEAGEVEEIAEVTAKRYVQSITLDKTEETIIELDNVKLTATVKPEDSENKEVTWESSDEKVATVDSTGLVTGVKVGSTTITARAKDGSNKTAECKITVETNWELMNATAKVIANDSSITSSSETATVTVDGKSRTINVGDIFDAKYNGEKRRVRVLGFKHDDLVNTSVYGGTHTKAGISFEFLDFMTGSDYKSVNNSDTNSGGWAKTQMRKDLNGYTTNSATQSVAIGGLGANLNNKSYIKQVKKKYIATYNIASSVTMCDDFLWLLACSEIWNVEGGHDISGISGGYGLAVTSEGTQYQYYKVINPIPSVENDAMIKKSTESEAAYAWWLRSPSYYINSHICRVNPSGQGNNGAASVTRGVAPGFCI